MTIRIDGTNTTANPGITGADADTGLQFGTDEVKIVTGGTDAITVDSSQRVGLGTSSVSSLAELRGSAQLYSTAAGFTFTDSSGQATANRWFVGNAAANTYGDFTISSAPDTSSTTYTSRLLINSSGNVGIGIAAPQSPLHVFRTGDTAIQITNSTTGSGASDGSQIAVLNPSMDLIVRNRENANLRLFTSNTERMRIQSNGLVHTFSNSDGMGIAIAGSSNNLLYCTNNATATGTGTIKFIVRGDGDVENATGVYTSPVSDERFKTDIVDVGSQWDDIKNVKLKKFRYKNNPDGELQLGIIAQELEPVCPNLIKRKIAGPEEVAASDGAVQEGEEYLSWKASLLPLKAVKALQEAMERIETLETQNAEQATTIASFEARISALEGGN